MWISHHVLALKLPCVFRICKESSKYVQFNDLSDLAISVIAGAEWGIQQQHGCKLRCPSTYMVLVRFCIFITKLLFSPKTLLYPYSIIHQSAPHVLTPLAVPTPAACTPERWSPGSLSFFLIVELHSV
jgi:hypothetical protein